MRLLIDIPEETVNEIKDNAMFAGTIPSEILWDVTSAIINGTPHETVTEFADRCRECGREKVIDKIRAEIEQNAYPIVHGVNNHEKGMTLYGILQIIDKYKAERSDKESKTEPKYCDRNICVSNEYSGIECKDCEVTKSQEPQESEE